MLPWDGLSTDEMQLLNAAFWSAGGSRHGMADRLGYSKSKANALIAGLVEQGLLMEAGLQRSSGGRRPETLQLHPELGALLGVDIGATSLDVALLRPDLTLLARHAEPADVRQGPGVVLARVRTLMRELLARCGIAPRQVIGIGIGVPGPVDFASGQLVNPPLMPGWDSFSIRDLLREDYAAPVFVDNDVNLMALGELWRLQRALPNFLVIKVGTGIGCGIVCHGEVYRGAAGAAGDVGHICVDQEGPRCHCGNLIGQMLASVVNFFNPSHVFIGGGITGIGPLFLAAVRQSVYQRSLALSTRHLEIQYTPLGAQAGLIGAGVLAIHETLKVRGVAP